LKPPLVFVESKTIAKKIGYEQSRITLICVALDQIIERFVESPYCSSDSFSRTGLPLWSRPFRVPRLAGVGCLNHRL
jgi:hypothetical protein